MSTPTATPRTDEAQFGTGRVSVDFARTLETELAHLRAEVSEARRAWLGDDYGHLPLIEALEKFRSDSDAESDRADVLYQRSCEVEHALRTEIEQKSNLLVTAIKLVGDQAARAERAEAALAFIASNGGTTHETECGAIACNGSWCAEQARAALDATKEKIK